MLDLARRLNVAPSSLSLLLGGQPKEIEFGEFNLDRYEVTNREYRQFLQVPKSPGTAGKAPNGHVPAAWSDPALNQPDHPVVGVTWHAAAAYCRWAGKHLPTADEWERAARGSKGRLYPWGDEFQPGRCNTAESGDRKGQTAAIGAYPECRSPEGVFDLVGNADEWTADSAAGSDNQDARVIKGGGWNESGELRGLGHIRPGAAADYDGKEMGFRCAAAPRKSWWQRLLAWVGD